MARPPGDEPAPPRRFVAIGAVPHIANITGWATAELGRQPWLVYGLFRTRDGASHAVFSGDVIFTLIGWVGLYIALAILFLGLIAREISLGPSAAGKAHHG